MEGTYTLPHGAGPETVSKGSYGYNTSGGYGKYENNNGYKYRYKYSYIWIDVTIIHTSFKTWGNNDETRYGYYANNLQTSTGTGQNLILNLHGAILDTPAGQTPFFHFFEILKTQTSAIPFNDIKNRNNTSTALEIATIKFQSDHKAARITFSSDSGGMNTNFSFKALGTTTGPSFTHKLAFQSTLPAANVVEITSANHSFVSLTQSKTSPIGDTSYTYVLEGKIKLFVPQGTVPPVGGTYRSTIYILVEPTT